MPRCCHIQWLWNEASELSVYSLWKFEIDWKGEKGLWQGPRYDSEYKVPASRSHKWLQQWNEQCWHSWPAMRKLPYRLMDAKTKMVVGHVDVGHPTPPCQCIFTVQDCPSNHLEKRENSILSHYEFWCQIALEWLGWDTTPKSDASASQKWKPTATLASSLDSSHDTKKAKRVINATLDPHSGALQIKLDDHYHYPIKSKAIWPSSSLWWMGWYEPKNKRACLCLRLLLCITLHSLCYALLYNGRHE